MVPVGTWDRLLTADCAYDCVYTVSVNKKPPRSSALLGGSSFGPGSRCRTYPCMASKTIASANVGYTGLLCTA